MPAVDAWLAVVDVVRERAINRRGSVETAKDVRGFTVSLAFEPAPAEQWSCKVSGRGHPADRAAIMRRCGVPNHIKPITDAAGTPVWLWKHEESRAR